MDDSEERQQLEEKLPAALKKALEQLKAEGVAEADVESASTEIEDVWRCSANFTKGDLLLQTNFIWEPGMDLRDLEDTVLREMREAFKRGEWTD